MYGYRVTQAIQQSAMETCEVDKLEMVTKKQLKAHKKKANQLVKRIRATISNALIRYVHSLFSPKDML